MTAVLKGTAIHFYGRRGIRIAIPSADITHINAVDVSLNTPAQNMAVIVAAMVPTAGYTAEYTAILDLATAQGFALPSDPTKTAHNSFIVALKAAGLWGEFDLINIYYGDMAQDFARINWVNPVAGALATLVNAPTYTNKRGFNSDGSTSYILTGFNPSTGTNYTLNDAACGYFGYNDVSSNRLFGGAAGGTINISAKAGAASICAINAASPAGLAASTNDGLIGGVRTSASDIEIFQNATSLASSAAAASTAAPTELRALSNGAASGPNTWQVQAAFAGSSTLYADGGTAISTAFNTLMATVL